MKSADSKARKWSGTNRCSDGHCAEAEKVDDGVKLTSTIAGTGSITYTRDEFAVLLSAAKAGELDHLI